MITDKQYFEELHLNINNQYPDLEEMNQIDYNMEPNKIVQIGYKVEPNKIIYVMYFPNIFKQDKEKK